MLPTLGLDMTDMLRGEGEWKNMQEVVRNSFRVAFEQLEKQCKQMSGTLQLMGQLRQKVGESLDEGAVKEMLTQYTSQLHHFIDRDEFDNVLTSLAELRSDTARKATTKYVDDSLKRKMDRSDVLIKNAPHLSSGPEVVRLTKENNNLKKRVEALETMMESVVEQGKLAAQQADMNSIKAQVDHVFEKVQEVPTRTDILALVGSKVEIVDMESQLNNKADRGSVAASMSQLEKVIAEHEKTLTSLRLKMSEVAKTAYYGSGAGSGTVRFQDNQPGFFPESPRYMGSPTRGVSPSPLMQHTASSSVKKNVKKGKDSGDRGRSRSRSPLRGQGKGQENYSSAESINVDVMGIQEANDKEDFSIRLRSMQAEAVINQLWTKLQKASKDISVLRNENVALNERMHVVEMTSGDMVTKDMYKDRALYESEQQTKERIALERFQQDVTAFLMLPQKRTLGDHMDQIGSIVNTMSSKVHEFDVVMAGLHHRFDDFDAKHHLMDARMVMVEENAERIISLQKHCDVAATGFEDLRAMGSALNNVMSKLGELDLKEKSTEGLFRSLEERLAETRTSVGRTEESTKYMYARLESNENVMSTLKQHIVDVDQRVNDHREVKYLSSVHTTPAPLSMSTSAPMQMPMSVPAPTSPTTEYAEVQVPTIPQPVTQTVVVPTPQSQSVTQTVQLANPDFEFPAALMQLHSPAQIPSLDAVNDRLTQLRLEKERLQKKLSGAVTKNKSGSSQR